MQLSQYDQLSRDFSDPAKKYKPDLYLETVLLRDEVKLRERLKKLAEAGVGCVIPVLTESRENPGEAGLHRMQAYSSLYANLLEKITVLNLDVEFLFEAQFERDYLVSVDEGCDISACAKELLPIEYACRAGEDIHLLLRGDALMSVVALEEETSRVIDLRGYVDGRNLTWSAPTGNWKIIQFVCADCTDEDGIGTRINPLSYETSLDYLQHTYAAFAHLFDPLRGKNFRAIGYRDIAFDAPNRRNWDPDFNRVFSERFGFDPALLYPALFYDIGPQTERYKALLLDCRAHMLAEGILRAYNDFAEMLGVELRGSLREPKLPSCSLLNGDALLGGQYAAGAMLEKAYLYGANSVKLAAGAAYNYGLREVSCEIFRDYPAYAADTYYSEACNAFSHGANRMLIHHVPAVQKDGSFDFARRGDFYRFAARTQALLQRGNHVADIAMLYPIYSIHAQTYFYQAEAQGFEYPNTPTNLDYMSLINSISIYAGHDLTLLHPETLRGKCRVEKGKLLLDNGKNTENFRVLILPSTVMIAPEDMRIIAQFYAAGGKIISTGQLPRTAFGTDESGEADLEVQALVKEIFGEDIFDGNILRSYDYRRNAAGGEAYHLTAEFTAIDGTDMVPGALIDETIKSLDLPYDVLMPGMIHLECTGALSLPYPDFVRLGLDKFIPGKGMLSHTHKRYGQSDIYYFANTTDRTYDRPILLRGAQKLEVWDPHSGIREPLEVAYVTYRGEEYTEVRLKLASGRSLFFISPDDVDAAISENIDSIEDLK